MKPIRAILRDELLRMAREELQLVACEGDHCGPIPPENIVWTRNVAGGKNQDFDPDSAIEVPGLLLSAPKIILPPSEGENHRDDWHYQWLWQIVDRETGHPTENQDTYWRWQEQIASLFNFSKLHDIVTSPRGCNLATTATMVDDLDEKVWSRSRLFIAGIIVDTPCRQPRGVV